MHNRIVGPYFYLIIILLKENS